MNFTIIVKCDGVQYVCTTLMEYHLLILRFVDSGIYKFETILEV